MSDFVRHIYKLWASYTDIADKQENHQRTTMIVLEKIFYKIDKKSGDQKPL